MLAAGAENHVQWASDRAALLLQAWSDIMTQVAADPWASAYTIFDILNEPDSHGLGWQANGANPGVGDLYHQVMTAGYSINPSEPRSRPMSDCSSGAYPSRQVWCYPLQPCVS